VNKRSSEKLDKFLGENSIDDIYYAKASEITVDAPITVNQRSSVKLNKFFGESTMGAVEANGIAPVEVARIVPVGLAPTLDPEVMTERSAQKLSKFFGENVPTDLIKSPIKTPRLHAFEGASHPLYFFQHSSSLSSEFDDCSHDFDTDDEDVSNHDLKSSSNVSIASSPTHARKWNSETDSEKLVQHRSPKIATFDEMIDFFTDPHRPSLADDLDAFILCLPSFADPIRVVSALRTRFNACIDRSDSFIASAEILEMRLTQVKF